MKKLLFISLILTCFAAVNAQTGKTPEVSEQTEEPECPEDTIGCEELGKGLFVHSKGKADSTGSYSDLHVGNLVISIWKKNDILKNEEGIKEEEEEGPQNLETRWFMFDLGVNGYLHDFSTTLPASAKNLELNPAKSINFNLHIFQQRLNLIRHKLNLHYGLMFKFNKYRFAQDITLMEKQDSLTIIASDIEYDKSKLAATYLMAPVMLKFNSAPEEDRRAFKFGIGGIGGYLMGGKTKVKYDNVKYAVEDDFNLKKLRYGARLEIGYSWFNIYTDYFFSPLFEEGEGPRLNPISVGLKFGEF